MLTLILFLGLIQIYFLENTPALGPLSKMVSFTSRDIDISSGIKKMFCGDDIRKKHTDSEVLMQKLCLERHLNINKNRI